MAAREEPQTRRRLKKTKSAKPKKTVVTAMQKDLRTHMVVLLNERAASRPEICKELGASTNEVRHEIDVLLSLDPPLIEQVAERPVRGTVEKFFRATEQARIEPNEWAEIPNSIKGRMRASLFDLIMDDAKVAIERGTFDAVQDAHMSWHPMILDEVGWEEQEHRALACQRRTGTSCTVSILGYASANKDRPVGPPRTAGEIPKEGQESWKTGDKKIQERQITTKIFRERIRG